MGTSYVISESQREIRDMVREFVKKEIIPHSAEWDEKSEFPKDVFKKVVEMGLTTCSYPDELGGLGMGSQETVIITEELAYGDAGFAVSTGACNLGVEPVMLGGTDAQKRYVVDVLNNGGMAAFGLTEASAGSDAAALRTTAVKDGNDYILNGSKCFITNGGIADIYTIFATVDKSKGPKGITAFLVDGNTPGFIKGNEENKFGIRTSNTTEITLQDVRVPKENIIGAEGIGYKLALQTLAKSRPAGAAGAVGICQRAVDLATEYAKQRVTFGKPIIANQAIQFMLADMEILTQAARCMVWNAATLTDHNLPEGTLGPATKTFCGDAAMKVTTDALQIFGGYGYSWEYPVEKLMRDAKIYQIFEGTNQIQRMVIAGTLAR